MAPVFTRTLDGTARLVGPLVGGVLTDRALFGGRSSAVVSESQLVAVITLNCVTFVRDYDTRR